MSIEFGSTPQAKSAGALVESLQQHFAKGLSAIDDKRPLDWVEWKRDEGRHGGGHRFCADLDSFPTWNRAAINVSHIHYDDLPERSLASANALSTIIHPRAPLAPSVHIHLSYTAMRTGKSYWRLMADLNPSTPNEGDKLRFQDALKKAMPEEYEYAASEGDRYFYIPALERHRGVTHFYLENYGGASFEADRASVERLGRAAMDCYLSILHDALAMRGIVADVEWKAQLDYHTLYFFQVLTLDRGTTSGLLVHSQNDLGIMGSLPKYIDGQLLRSWRDKVPALQQPLVDSLAQIVGDQEQVEIDDTKRLALAAAIRSFYGKYPAALDLQARGSVIPPTVANHADRD